LAQAYPDLYKTYLEEEKVNDIKSKGNGDRATRAATTDLGIRATATLAPTREAGNGGENEGNNGGEE
jgi:hypothetical protein